MRSGKRYTSNITIVEQEAEFRQLPQDILLRLLAGYTRGVFTGAYEGPGRGEIEKNFERTLTQIYARADTPRLSGVQIKAPTCLNEKGVLSPATGKPFTHILKPAGTSGYDARPVVEWMAMELGRAAGFEAPATALVAMPDRMPPALLVERFDIRESNDDARFLALEDMCSVLDLPTSAKYDGTMKRAVFAWLIALNAAFIPARASGVCILARRPSNSSSSHSSAPTREVLPSLTRRVSVFSSYRRLDAWPDTHIMQLAALVRCHLRSSSSLNSSAGGTVIITSPSPTGVTGQRFGTLQSRRLLFHSFFDLLKVPRPELMGVNADIHGQCPRVVGQAAVRMPIKVPRSSK